MPNAAKGSSEVTNYGSLQREGTDDFVHDQEHVEDGSTVKQVTKSAGIPTSRKIISTLLLVGLSVAGFLTVSHSGNHPVFLDDTRLSAIRGNPGLHLTPEDKKNLDFTRTMLEDRAASLEQELDTTRESLAAIHQLVNPGQVMLAEAATAQVPSYLDQLSAVADAGQAANFNAQPQPGDPTTTDAGQATDSDAQLHAQDLIIAQLQQQLQQLQQQLQQEQQKQQQQQLPQPQQQPLPQPPQPQQWQQQPPQPQQWQQQPPQPQQWQQQPLPGAGFHPFTSTIELYAAVDAYMAPGMTQRMAVMSYYGPIGSWDVSQISDFSHLFDSDRCDDCDYFNEDLSGWNVGRATNMASMFEGNKYFNQDLSKWDVSHVQDFSKMFSGCTSFQQNLSFWMIPATANTLDMFKGVNYFNPAFYPRVNPVVPVVPGGGPMSPPVPGGYPPFPGTPFFNADNDMYN